MKRLALMGAAVAALALLYTATTAQSRIECEACMRFGGQTRCSRVAGPTRGEAQQRAVSHACGVLTSGVTRSLECQRTPPLSLSCQD